MNHASLEKSGIKGQSQLSSALKDFYPKMVEGEWMTSNIKDPKGYFQNFITRESDIILSMV